MMNRILFSRFSLSILDLLFPINLSLFLCITTSLHFLLRFPLYFPSHLMLSSSLFLCSSMRFRCPNHCNHVFILLRIYWAQTIVCLFVFPPVFCLFSFIVLPQNFPLTHFDFILFFFL